MDRSRAVVVIDGSRSIAGCARMDLLDSWLQISKREGTKVGRTAGGMTSLGRQLVNSRAPEITIYLRTYWRASFHCSGVNSLHMRSALVLHKQTRLDSGDSQYSSETSGPISNGGGLKRSSPFVANNWMCVSTYMSLTTRKHYLPSLLVRGK